MKDLGNIMFFLVVMDIADSCLHFRDDIKRIINTYSSWYMHIPNFVLIKTESEPKELWNFLNSKNVTYIQFELSKENLKQCDGLMPVECWNWISVILSNNLADIVVLRDLRFKNINKIDSYIEKNKTESSWDNDNARKRLIEKLILNNKKEFEALYVK